MAQNISIPVINALSDRFHPCQALADYFTLQEKFGSLKDVKLAYVGDGNNVCHSLIFLAARLGVNLRIATPASYAPAPDVIADAKRVAKETRAKIELFRLLGQQFANSAGHRHAIVRVDVDLAHAVLDTKLNLFHRHAVGLLHLAAVLVDDVLQVLRHAG